jgi:hypothetical protein
VSRFGRLPLCPPESTLRHSSKQLSLIESVNLLLGKVVTTRCSDHLTDGGIATENGRFWNLTGPPSGERWLTSFTPP